MLLDLYVDRHASMSIYVCMHACMHLCMYAGTQVYMIFLFLQVDRHECLSESGMGMYV